MRLEEEERLAAEERAREAKRPRHQDLPYAEMLEADADEKDVELALLESTLSTLPQRQRRVGDIDAFDFDEGSDSKKEKREAEELREKMGNLKVVSRAKVTQDRAYTAAYHPEPTKDLVFFGGSSLLPALHIRLLMCFV